MLVPLDVAFSIRYVVLIVGCGCGCAEMVAACVSRAESEEA